MTFLKPRTPVATSIPDTQPLRYVASASDVFTVKPLRLDSGIFLHNVAFRNSKADQHPSKTPVPKIVGLNEEKENPENYKPQKPVSDRKTFRFDQEFLALLRNYNSTERDEDNKAEPSSAANFWSGHQGENPADNQGEGPADNRGEGPADNQGEGPADNQGEGLADNQGEGPADNRGEGPADNRGEGPADNRGEGLADNRGEGPADSVWRLKGAARSSSTTNSAKEDALLHDRLLNLRGGFAESLRGLMAPATKSVSLTTLARVAEAPRIISVGEVGELPHQALQQPLLAALKQGSQSLHVSTWVSACPKLYDKVELNCAIHRDALVATALKMMWKKRTYLDGHVEEQVLAEDDLLKVEDPRIFLKQRHDQYQLVINDFRSRDCGSYMCEARAGGRVAASHLLLFTCL
nr:uncharacterized protein LOC123772787 [Procambarus clarkii]